MSSHRSWIVDLSPAPSNTTVSFLVTVSFLHDPRWDGLTSSNFIPVSSEMTVPPVSTARSCMVALRLSPKPGALTAQTLIPARNLLTTKVASASLSTSSATINNELCALTILSKIGTSCCKFETFFSTSKMCGFSNSHTWVLALVIKYGLMYPRSNFIPSTTSSSLSSVLPSCTVITPSFPTRSIASAIRVPISTSELAEIVPTCLISSLDVIGLLISSSVSTTHVTAAWIPLLKSRGFIPAATALHPSL
mmetsp:Transcript_18926/g.23844  ORF Transcript_18926/g.23844 Transcript_18926/m.23844 type:complete len:250 (-) Transcript_18926:84-833(-)